MSPEEWYNKETVENKSDFIMENLLSWSKYDINKFHDELVYFLKETDDMPLTKSQRKLVELLQLTTDKIFLYKK